MAARNDERQDPVASYLARKGVVLRVLLDTNVIQFLWSFGEYVYDGYLSPERERRLSRLNGNLRSDIECLRIILGEAPTRTPVIPLVSELSIRELEETGDSLKRARLLRWGIELMAFASPSQSPTSKWRHQSRLDLKWNLPGTVDQLLLGECRRLNCEAIVTTDHKSILSRRKGGRIDGILVLSPTEWWTRLRPWWALWV